MLDKIRFFLIEKLASDRPVMLNVTILSEGKVDIKSTGKKGLINKTYIRELGASEIENNNA